MKPTHSIFIALLTVLIWPNAVIASPTSSSSSRYQAWSPPGGETIGHSSSSQNTQQQMIERLNVLIDDAEKAHASDKNFIRDLRNVLDEYSRGNMQPGKSQLLYEDFTDGVVSKNPAWLGPSASFKLERGRGMYSRIASSGSTRKQGDDALANAVLGAIFKSGSNASTGDHANSGPATLYVRTPVSNTFTVKASIDVRSTQGRLALGLFQGKPSDPSYQLVFITGSSASIELQRVSSRGTTRIKIKDHLKASTNHTFQLIWTRDRNGNMSVDLDGKTILQTADNAIRGAFDGFSVTNHGGEFYLRSVELSGVR